MAFTARERLRQVIGEVVPDGGSDSDTLFSDAQIQDFLDRAEDDLDKAAYYGWQAKAAEYASLVNVTEGNSARDMSDLHAHAMAQWKMLGLVVGITTDSTRGRVKIGRIVRASE